MVVVPFWQYIFTHLLAYAWGCWVIYQWSRNHV